MFNTENRYARMQSGEAARAGANSVAIAARASLTCFGIIIGAGCLAGLVPASWQGNWTAHVVRLQPHFVDRFFPFDAVWYQRIASDGYSWNPADAASKQDVAFLPLWPMILRLIAASLGSGLAAKWCAVAAAAISAFASIWAFHRLALRFLPADQAQLSVWLAALTPGASFLLLSYPTGLMNLLCILALLSLLDGRVWVAAVCSGLATAAGPLGLGTGLTVCLCSAGKLRRRCTDREISRSGKAMAAAICSLQCGVAVAGLASFIVWQHFALGDAFAMTAAQAAWAPPLPFGRRVLHSLALLLLAPDFVGAVREIAHAAHGKTLVAAQGAVERALNDAALAIMIVAILACWRLRARLLFVQGSLTVLLFIWFHSATRPGIGTFRLMYCAVGIFIGLAWLLQRRPWWTAATLAACALMMAASAFLSAAGYHVV
jgi:hypothetical protein